MIKGFVDIASSGRVSGWAFDDANPSEHLMIIVNGRGGRIVAGKADILRPDLAGIAGNGDHSFRFEISPNLQDGDIQVRATSAGGDDVVLLEMRDTIAGTLESRVAAIEARLDASEVFLMRLDEMLRKIIEADKKKRKRWLGIF